MVALIYPGVAPGDPLRRVCVAPPEVVPARVSGAPGGPSNPGASVCVEIEKKTGTPPGLYGRYIYPSPEEYPKGGVFSPVDSKEVTPFTPILLERVRSQPSPTGWGKNWGPQLKRRKSFTLSQKGSPVKWNF